MLDYNNNPAIKRREYSKIFTGTNQENGYENIFLSFSATTKEIKFEPSKITYFHYSNFVPKISIHQADLITDGATAGISPARADKVYKKLANYSRYTAWGNSLDKQRGIWLCAWLSGSTDPNGTAQWVDRYYNPGYISLQDALTAVNEVYISNTRVVFDNISTLTFDPGVLYMYHHFGNVENQIVINSLSGSNSSPYLRLKIDDWTTDKSTFNNTGNLNFSEAIHVEKINDIQTITLSLSNDVDVEYKIPYSKTFLPDDYFTVSSWVKSKNWGQVKGNQIFGNYFRGGWGLCYEAGIVDPLMVIFENSNGHILFGNQVGNIYSDKILNAPVADNNYVTLSGVAISNDLYIWAITNGISKALYKLDYNGDILSTVSYPASANITDLVLDANNNVYVLDNAASAVYKYDPETTQLISQTEIPSGDNRMEFQSVGLLVTKTCDAMAVDQADNVWFVTTPNPAFNRLTKNTTVIPVAFSDFRAMKVDAQNQLWVLYGNKTWMKFNTSTNEMSLSGTIGYNDLSGCREIAFTKEFKDGQYVDYGWILQGSDQRLYKIDLAGKVLEEIDLVNKLNFIRYPVIKKEDMKLCVRGDWTGTQWANKFQYLQNHGVHNLYYNITFQQPDGTIITKKLKYNLDILADDQWYMFTLTFNSSNGKVTSYVNSVIADSATVPVGSKIYFKYQNNLIFGGNSGKFTSMDEELQLNQLHFNGDLAEPVIYSRELTQADISHLFRSKYDAQAITWNLPIGKQVFIEEVERMFKHKLIGQKSNFFNIRLTGLNITDLDIQGEIENIIRKTVKKVAPAHSELLNIIWQ